MLQLLLFLFPAEMGSSGEGHQAMAGCEPSTVKRRLDLSCPGLLFGDLLGTYPREDHAHWTKLPQIKLPQQFPRHETIEEI